MSKEMINNFEKILNDKAAKELSQLLTEASNKFCSFSRELFGNSHFGQDSYNKMIEYADEKNPDWRNEFIKKKTIQEVSKIYSRFETLDYMLREYQGE